LPKEAAGLAIGVAGLVGLFDACLDIISRVDSYKDFGAESAALKAYFKADTVRFQQWGKNVGFDKGKLRDSHYEALDEASVRSAVDQILQSIKSLVGDVNDTRSGFPGPDQSGLQDRGAHRREGMPFDGPQGVHSRRYKLEWALGGKEKFLALVSTFGGLVQKLYDLVPPVQFAAGWGVPESSTPSGIYPRKTHSFPNKLLIYAQETSCGPLTRKGFWPSWKNKCKVRIPKHNPFHAGKLNLIDEFRKTIFDWLDSHSTNNMYENFVDRRLDGTCDWILNCAEFLRWQSSEIGRPKLFWLYGHAGYGKKITCARIIQHLSTLSSHPLAYFFSSELGSREDPFVVIRSWISQITTKDQEAFELAKKKYEVANGQTASRNEIQELLMEIVRIIPRCTFVIDGLDECAGVGHGWMVERKNSLLQFFGSLKRPSRGLLHESWSFAASNPKFKKA
jgi:hypothetical protein